MASSVRGSDNGRLERFLRGLDEALGSREVGGTGPCAFHSGLPPFFLTDTIPRSPSLFDLLLNV